MKKYIRIELVDNEIQNQAMVEDMRLGIINDKNILEVVANPVLTKSDVSISQTMVNAFISNIIVSTIGDKTTMVQVTLVNGFEIIETSACVSKENYNEIMGKEICLNKIKDKIWMLLGFLLQSAVGGVK